ncbi:hypothetical protein [Prevotella corporis]|uniref:hypothetical protein n=1 Tax=Prevotella corporis TaxID=28128 RepID=UPI00056CDF12|nr:hypothetical protein [Prevotella corporis]
MNRKFVLGVLAFLVFVFVLQWNAPSKFVWQPTYLHTDRQPFGCAVFDSLVQSSLSQDYSVTNKTLPQLLSEGKQPRAIMVNAINFTPTVTDLKAMKQLLRRGNKIMLVVHDYRPESRCVDVIPVWIDSYGTFSHVWCKSVCSRWAILWIPFGGRTKNLIRNECSAFTIH